MCFLPNFQRYTSDREIFLRWKIHAEFGRAETSRAAGDAKKFDVFRLFVLSVTYIGSQL